jgi:hypothetical protein
MNNPISSTQDLIETVLKPLRLEELSLKQLAAEAKLKFNSIWIGCLIDPLKGLAKLKLLKRIGILHFSIGTYFDYKNQELIVWTDSGRLLRPLYFIEHNDISFKRQDYLKDSKFKKVSEKHEKKNKENKKTKNNIKNDVEEEHEEEINQDIINLDKTEKKTFLGDVMTYLHFISRDYFKITKQKEETVSAENEDERSFSLLKKQNIVDMLFDNRDLCWSDLIRGFFFKNICGKEQQLLNLYKQYENLDCQDFEEMKGIIDYIDLNEQNTILISPSYSVFRRSTYLQHYQYIEICSDFCLGITNMYSPFINHSQYNMYNMTIKIEPKIATMFTNWKLRMDIGTEMTLLLNTQSPLVRTIYEEFKPIPPTGINLIVCVMDHATNVCLNKASVERGLLKKRKLFSLEFYETETISFTNIAKIANIYGKRPWVNFENLDDDGIIKINAKIDYNTAIIGRVCRVCRDEQINYNDMMISEHSLLLSDFIKDEDDDNWYVDHTAIIKTDNNKRIVKVRLFKETLAKEGDFICTRNGMFSVIDEIRNEIDMPFTDSGERPDILLNPKLFIDLKNMGCLKELYFSSICCTYGGSIVVNPFDKILVNDTIPTFTNHLKILYDGYSGNQIEGDIFEGLAFFHLAPADTQEKCQTIPLCSLISIGSCNIPKQGSLDETILLPIDNITGNITKFREETTSCIEISRSFHETHALLTTMNIHARFITEDSYLKNLVSSIDKDSIHMLPSEVMCKNLENLARNNKLSDTLIKSDKKKMKRSSFEKIVFHPDSKMQDYEDKYEEDKENTFDIESIYQPENNIKSKLADIEIVNVDQALQLDDDDIKNVIIRQQEQKQEQTEESQKEQQDPNENRDVSIFKPTTNFKKPSQTSILDIVEKETDESDQADTSGDKNKTIILS